jgi:PAS domain-containing protein
MGLVEEGTKRVRPVTQAGFEDGYLNQIEVTWDDSPTGMGPTGTAIKTGEPSVMRDIESAPEFRPWRAQALERGYRSSAALPLRFKGRVLGTLNVYSDVADAFDIEEIGLLQEVADHLAYALGSIRLEEELAQVERRAKEAERVQSAFVHAPLGMLVTDAGGTVTGINRRMLDFLNGFQTLDEVVSRIKLPRLDVFSGSAGRAAVRKVLSEGETAEFECRVVGRDGVRRSLSCQGVPIRGENDKLMESLWFVQEAGEGRVF